MSADWKAGDKALCVEPFVAIKTEQADVPRVGTIYLVEGVGLANGDIYSLFLSGMKSSSQLFGCGNYGYAQRRFRKIVPACDRIAQEQAVEQPQ